MKNLQLSALIPTFNCADTINSTLESLSWADEIVVVDSFSNDDTVEICEKYGARVLRHVYETPARQKNWAIPQCVGEWILQLDSDEVLEDGMQHEIRMAIANAGLETKAYRIPRMNHVLGQWVRYGGIYPDYQIRLFRRKCGRFQDRYVHEHLDVPGDLPTLRHHILHYGMPNLSKQLRNLDRYTRYEADEALKQGQRFFWPYLLLKPIGFFLHRYVRLQGFRAGWRGFYLAAYIATYSFWVQAKLWELSALGLEESPKQ